LIIQIKADWGERVRFTLDVIDKMKLSDVKKFSILTERRGEREE